MMTKKGEILSEYFQRVVSALQGLLETKNDMHNASRLVPGR